MNNDADGGFFRKRGGGPQVFALVGASGTGKSYHAKLAAARFRAEYIIDDGLLIRGDKIVAGQSAKEEKTFIAAVKAAVFDDKDRRDAVARKLEAADVRGVLLLGTSVKMVRKIAARLQLPFPSKVIFIEDFATQDEIDRALRTRRVEGKHVIPLPSVEVMRGYPNIFFAPIAVLFKKKTLPLPVLNAPAPLEKSLVRPAYSRPQMPAVSGAALALMAENCVNEFGEGFTVNGSDAVPTEAGCRVRLTVNVGTGTRLEERIERLRQFVTEDIERFTGVPVEDVGIVIDRLAEQAE